MTKCFWIIFSSIIQYNLIIHPMSNLQAVYLSYPDIFLKIVQLYKYALFLSLMRKIRQDFIILDAINPHEAEPLKLHYFIQVLFYPALAYPRIFAIR